MLFIRLQRIPSIPSLLRRPTIGHMAKQLSKVVKLEIALEKSGICEVCISLYFIFPSQAICRLGLSPSCPLNLLLFLSHFKLEPSPRQKVTPCFKWTSMQKGATQLANTPEKYHLWSKALLALGSYSIFYQKSCTYSSEGKE